MDSTRSTKQILMVAMAAAALLFVGCAKGKVEVTSEKPVVAEPVVQEQAAKTTAVYKGQTGRWDNGKWLPGHWDSDGSWVDAPVVTKPSNNGVYFAFDSAVLESAGQATLDGYVAWLNANVDEKITVEGNCDERGSREYNLALGQRRADSVRDFMVANGVSADRIDTVSFGEERAVCKGTGEACWAQNRRGDIVSR
ncbi:MAG: peptidoglycan-associated lipoprotein Pal [Mariprofundus sp.]|nr:peptidoglycan-associated lipoprotein Pal [Mariprofundus sp.]